MAHTISAVIGSGADLMPTRTALISVSDKTGVASFASALSTEFGVTILSTGGTAKALRDAGVAVTDVCEHTHSPEILDGRVKTLHPVIHGGLLAVRGNDAHAADCAAHGIVPIDLVVVNLYAFTSTVEKGSDFATCIENIDIGGPSMIRSAAKNNAAVAVLVDPAQYDAVLAQMRATAATHAGVAHTTLAMRKSLAAAAFAHTAAYDGAIAAWFAGQVEAPVEGRIVTRSYVGERGLKYGCNPHQSPAFIGRVMGAPMPFTVVNGVPGYINLLDAVNAWQLAKELADATGLAAAASFKHVSPAGAAVAVPISADLASVYECAAPDALTPVACAYLRARNADPMCSFGDFAAVSHVVDEPTALLLKPEVSDGIIAPGYTPAALDILKAKKGGAFIILQSKPEYSPGSMEYREVYGCMFAQRRNDTLVSAAHVTGAIKSARGAMPPDAVRDLLVALIAIKYTQSNSVGYAMDGQMIGVGAGQQSRVDCVKLAGRKVSTWWMRQHPKVRGLKFKPEVKRTARVNARVRYIEGDFTKVEYDEWVTNFDAPPEALTEGDKAEWMKSLTGVSLASDAFFPFRDSLDHAAKFGVSYVSQPGGSVQDEDVVKAANEYGMAMSFSGLRLFHH